MKRKLMLLAFASFGLTATAQGDVDQNLQVLNERHSEYIPVTQYWREHDIFQHLDLSVTAGSTGIGLELSSPIGEYLQLRAGFDYMPRFTKKMEFIAMIGDESARQYDANGNRVSSTFDRMQEALYNFTGLTVDDHVDMIGKPTMNNFKVLLDVFPFKSSQSWVKNIHFTGGFYWGSSQFAEAVNSIESMNSLAALSIYNSLYQKAYNQKYVPPYLPEPIIVLPDPNGGEGIEMSMTREMMNAFLSYGRMGFKIGEFSHDIYDASGNLVHAEGDTYLMEADEQNMVVVKAKSNAFKPYLGFGYGGRLMKHRDDWKVSFDAGLWFWGGTPDLYIHDGVNLTNDVRNIKGQVGDYVDIFKKFTVYPVLNVKFSKTLF